MTEISKSSNQFFTAKPFHRALRSIRYERLKVLNPHWFQGNRQRKNYFEGWYFKNVSKDESHSWSFIPGISLVKGDAHAFVQAINGLSGQTFYFRYPADSFTFSADGFEIYVGSNYFSDSGFALSLTNGEHRFEGKVQFKNTREYPVGVGRPGIMGWYRYVPFMECYHGVVSLDHQLAGSISHNGHTVDFQDGRGYIEKDWGSSMPQSWVWMQTNHFGQPGTSFMLSVARIPWIGKDFTGFLGFFLHNGKVFSFATYTGAKITRFEYDENEVKLLIESKKHQIKVHAKKAQAKKAKSGGLKAPVFGNMERVIHESLDAEIDITHTGPQGETLFEGSGKNAGFEMVGDLKVLGF